MRRTDGVILITFCRDVNVPKRNWSTSKLIKPTAEGEDTDVCVLVKARTTPPRYRLQGAFHRTHLQGHSRSSALGCRDALWTLSVAEHAQQGSPSLPQKRLRVMSVEGNTCCWNDSVQLRSDNLDCICLRGLSIADIFLDTGLRREASLPWAASWKVWVISSPWSVTQTWRPSPLPQRDPPSKQKRPSTTPYRLKQMKILTVFNASTMRQEAVNSTNKSSKVSFL
jgi:hypothetical protein